MSLGDFAEIINPQSVEINPSLLSEGGVNVGENAFGLSQSTTNGNLVANQLMPTSKALNTTSVRSLNINWNLFSSNNVSGIKPSSNVIQSDNPRKLNLQRSAEPDNVHNKFLSYYTNYDSYLLHPELFDEVASIGPAHRQLADLARNTLPTMTYGITAYVKIKMTSHAAMLSSDAPSLFDLETNYQRMRKGENSHWVCNGNSWAWGHLMDTFHCKSWKNLIIYDKSHPVAHYSNAHIPRTPENEELLKLIDSKEFMKLSNEKKLELLEKAGAVAVDPSKRTCQLIKQGMDLHIDNIRTTEQQHNSISDSVPLPFNKILIQGSLNLFASEELIKYFCSKYPKVINPHTQILFHIGKDAKIHFYAMNLDDINNVRSFEDENDPDHKVFLELLEKVLNDKESPAHDFLRMHNLPYKNIKLDNYRLSLTTKQFKWEINHAVKVLKAYRYLNSSTDLNNMLDNLWVDMLKHDKKPDTLIQIRNNVSDMRDSLFKKDDKANKESVKLLIELLKYDPAYVEECCEQDEDKEFAKELIKYYKEHQSLSKFIKTN